MKKGWLSDADWAMVRRSVPIACVDVLVWSGEETVERVGLIFRETPLGRPGWCVVGGRLMLEETLAEGIARQLGEALGEGIRFSLEAEPTPIYMAQYFPRRADAKLVDPRQHAVTMMFAVKVEGEIRAQGEARDFRWFDVNALPSAEEFGFGQRAVVEACLGKMNR